jgi:hypothetical protein
MCVCIASVHVNSKMQKDKSENIVGLDFFLEKKNEAKANSGNY